MEEFSVSRYCRARQDKVAAVDRHHHKGQVKRVDLVIEYDAVAAVSVTKSDGGKVGAMQLGDCLSDHDVIQQRLDQHLLLRHGRIRPSHCAGRRNNIKRAAKGHQFSAQISNSCAASAGGVGQ